MVSDNLPEACYVEIPGNPVEKSVGLVKRGESGYYTSKVTPLPGSTRGEIKALVEDLNTELKVTPRQAECMLVGSMWGWDVPGAQMDPATVLKEDFDTESELANAEIDLIQRGYQLVDDDKTLAPGEFHKLVGTDGLTVVFTLEWEEHI